ncbi:hypothetical protein IEQ34_015967 [Dendrobium chrysotoxum]|uniref:Cytochrome P450 n=1 Tax=Dendrobium chrysotoxum TaxID=161865 RepID=A0AAV7GIA5_DENCH|nr:hypothetical protein IEQ34_015967 [Dendrobium chrysotoxum]
MKKTQDEVREIANGDEMITEEHLCQLKYLNAVIKEKILRKRKKIISNELVWKRPNYQRCSAHNALAPD